MAHSARRRFCEVRAVEDTVRGVSGSDVMANVPKIRLTDDERRQLAMI
jgi:hypothetical protein